MLSSTRFRSTVANVPLESRLMLAISDVPPIIKVKSVDPSSTTARGLSCCFTSPDFNGHPLCSFPVEGLLRIKARTCNLAVRSVDLNPTSHWNRYYRHHSDPVQQISSRLINCFPRCLSFCLRYINQFVKNAHKTSQHIFIKTLYAVLYINIAKKAAQKTCRIKCPPHSIFSGSVFFHRANCHFLTHRFISHDDSPSRSTSRSY